MNSQSTTATTTPYSSPSSSPKLMRQITEQNSILGIPEADAKIFQNNMKNHVKKGQDGYIPLSYDFKK